MTIGQKQVKLTVIAYIEDGRTYIPLRDFVESLNGYLHWDDSGLIIISTEKLHYENISSTEAYIVKLKEFYETGAR